MSMIRFPLTIETKPKPRRPWHKPGFWRDVRALASLLLFIVVCALVWWLL